MTATVSWLECTTCHETFDHQPLLYGCPSCAERGDISSVEVRYQLDSLDPDSFMMAARSVRPPSLWRWSSLLPPVGEHQVTLGEGDTPLAPLRTVTEALGVKRAFVKHEASNPTGSFKDRLNAVAVGMGLRLGFSRATISSSGNQGVSLGTYARVAGMQAIVFTPPYVETKTLTELMLRGVQPVVLSSYGDAALALVNELVKNHGWYVSSRNFPRPFANPFGLEGYKTIAFEIVEQLGTVPDWVFVPTGGGDSIYGIWKGFRELRELGVIDRAPRMVACQAGGASIVRAIEQDLAHAPQVPSVDTLAVSIRHTRSGDHGIWAVRESDGGAVAVEDDEITAAVASVGRDGLCLAPSSAASVAGAVKLAARGELGADETVVCIGTATCLRWSLTFAHLEDEVPLIPRIDPDLDQLNRLLAELAARGG
jgi:threonine synthase